MGAIGPYATSADTATWPLLPSAQHTALYEISRRRVAVVWRLDQEHPGLGLKPWYALTAGVTPRQLHVLWLYGLLRLDRGGGPILRLAADSSLGVARARLTPLGQRVLEYGT